MWKTVMQDRSKRQVYADWAKERDSGIGAFLEFDPERGAAIPASLSPGELYDAETDNEDARSARKESGERVKGVPFGLKDNLALRSFKLTCGSRMLETVVAPYSATAVERDRKSVV